MSERFIHCENLIKIYKVADLEVLALQGLDLQVNAGEMLALIGPSGSGKSTLMSILGGLDTPSAGQVRVGAHDLLEMRGKERVRYRRAVVGFVWQQTARNLLPYLTAQENVEMPMALNGVGKRTRVERARALLAQVGLERRFDFRPHRLSGGEQQRVAIAVAMANQPKLLLADEPTGEVDSETSHAIFDTFRALQREYGVTLIIVTHDGNVANRVDRIIEMRDGRASREVIRQRDSDGLPLQEEAYAILDPFGRLQLPHDYIESLQLRDRVQLNLGQDHVRVYPKSVRGATVSHDEE